MLRASCRVAAVGTLVLGAGGSVSPGGAGLFPACPCRCPPGCPPGGVGLGRCQGAGGRRTAPSLLRLRAANVSSSLVGGVLVPPAGVAAGVEAGGGSGGWLDEWLADADLVDGGPGVVGNVSALVGRWRPLCPRRPREGFWHPGSDRWVVYPSAEFLGRWYLYYRRPGDNLLVVAAVGSLAECLLLGEDGVMWF